MSIDLWHAWNHDRGNPAHLAPLMTAYSPYIGREVSRWSSSGLPQVVLEGQARKLTLDAFHSFDPKKGAQLQTHVVNQLKGLDRFVNTYREDVRMPVEKVHLANKVYRTKQELELELGREATAGEISDRSGVGLSTVGSLKRFQAGLYSNNELSGFAQPVREDLNHQQIAADFLYHDLTPQQQLVFAYSTGYGGKSTLPPGQIATKLGVSAARVSSIKNDIADKARRYQRAVTSLMA